MDLGHDTVDLGGDRQQRHPAVPFGVCGDEVGEPAVVRLRTGHAEVRVLVAGEAEAHTEGGRRTAVDGIRVREDDLRRHAVAVEFLAALCGVPAAAQALLVVPEPAVGEGLVADAEAGGLRAAGVPAAEEFVEGAVETGVEVGAVLLGGESGVAVGGDDQVRLVPGVLRVRPVRGALWVRHGGCSLSRPGRE